MIITLKEIMECLKSQHITKGSFIYMKCEDFLREMTLQNKKSVQVKPEDRFDTKIIKNLARIQRNSGNKKGRNP